MPYIKNKGEFLNRICDVSPETVGALCTNPGELNYIFTSIAHGYLGKQNELRYYRINEVIGALECCKLELYRIIAAPYEDKKKSENGPVSELDG